MGQTTARVTRAGKHYEILVDLDEAMKVKRGEAGASLHSAVLNDSVFYNLKAGDRAAEIDLNREFETLDFMEIAEKIIKSGEVVATAESMKGEQEQKYKQVVDFLVRNAVSPEGRPYTPDRIMKALGEAHVNVKNKPVEQQVGEIVDQLSRVLPMKMEIKKIKLVVPAIHTGRAYGIVREFMKGEEWKSNGDLEVVVEVPAGLVMDFYDKINGATQGSVLSEEIKE